MHMQKVVSRIVAPATLALILMFPGASHALITKAEADACADASQKCMKTYCMLYKMMRMNLQAPKM